MYVGSESVVVSFNVLCMAVSSTRRMFCSPGSLIEIFMFLSLLYIPYLAISLGLFGSSELGGIYGSIV
jgi:hypothetical protein